jgi:hypothetical protein
MAGYTGSYSRLHKEVGAEIAFYPHLCSIFLLPFPASSTLCPGKVWKALLEVFERVPLQHPQLYHL